MVAGHGDDLARRAGGRHPERIARPLDHERRDGDRVELGQSRLLRAARRMDREGEAEHAGGAGLRRGAAGHARARRAPAGHERQVGQRPATQVLDDRDPGRVELGRRRGRATARHAIGLLDQRDTDPERHGRLRRRDEVASRDPAPGAVAEHERAGRLVAGVQVHARRAVRRVDGEGRHRSSRRRSRGSGSSGCSKSVDDADDDGRQRPHQKVRISKAGTTQSVT